ncbi:hypothetical protein ACX0G7_27095 [Flavitalea antarctica]
MKLIMPNIWMLFLRVPLLAVFIYMCSWPIESLRASHSGQSDMLAWLGLALFFMFPLYLIWTLLGVLWVTVSPDNKLCRFYYLYKSIDVDGSDVESYYFTKHYTKLASFDGLLMKLRSGKTLEVTEYNLRSVKVIKQFLRYHRVPMKGEKRSWFPMTRQI